MHQSTRAPLTAVALLCHLQISHNAWVPLDLSALPSLVTLIARNASVRKFAFTPSPSLRIAELVLDDNAFVINDETAPSVFEGMRSALATLRSFSCQRCALAMDVTTEQRKLASVSSLR
jgi:hypothetical protein